MSLKLKALMLGVAAVSCVCVTAANAATVQFDDRTLFDAASASLQTETFASYATNVDLSSSTVLDVGDFTILGPATGIARIDADGFGITPVNGTAYVQGVGIAGEFMSFTFDTAITAFGVDLFAINNDQERTQVEIDSVVYLLPVVTGDLASFFGITSTTAFTTVTFNVLTQGLGEDAGFDNISYGTAVVPLPAALPLYGTGLAIAGLIGWRRARKAAAV